MSRLLAYFNYLDLRTFIDILIVAFVIYKLLLLIKGTRAVQLLKGLAVLLIASAVSAQFHLSTINWLVGKTWTALAVALPVVFQPELRRALEQLGRGSLFGRRSLLVEDEARRVARAAALAAENLSRRRVGALFVFTRETGLLDYVERGVKLDALVSEEAIINIFEPNTPLHDGAVIINGNRILAAACYLPLTENPLLSREMGTRHRAALGITEQSDALAVVVSEETGIISLADDGKMIRGLQRSELEKKLVDILGPGKAEDRYERFKRH
jgi:diadenylate cyclase